MAINQQSYFKKALNTVRSCTNALQLPAAERIVFQYDSLQFAFEENSENYDHEWHIYTLLAELSTQKKLLLS